MWMVPSGMAILFCTHTGTTNNLLTGDLVHQDSPNDATIICIFLSGFNGSARCSVQYGTDPTYSNLPYSAESTETGTAGDFVSVVLMEQLNSSTVYYYTVSAVSGDITVTVRRTFTTPQYGKCVCIYFPNHHSLLLPIFNVWEVTCTDSFHYTKIAVTYTSWNGKICGKRITIWNFSQFVLCNWVCKLGLKISLFLVLTFVHSWHNGCWIWW